jgi:hypothetical protein
MSWASAINFNEDGAEEDLLERREVASKGGWKRLYRPSRVAPDEDGFRRILAGRVVDRVRTELLGDAVEEPT